VQLPVNNSDFILFCR